jgi:signal transduction histidine kinase
VNRLLISFVFIFFCTGVAGANQTLPLEPAQWDEETERGITAPPESESERFFLQKAEQIENPRERLEYLVDQTWINRNSLPEVSLVLGLKAIELADSIGDYYNLVKSHSFTGVAYRLLGDYNNAIDLFFKGLHLSREHNIPQQEGYAYINIANLYIYIEFYTQALENLGPAMEIAREIGDQEMLSYTFLNQGRVLMHLNRTEEAIESITRSLEIRIETGNVPGQAVCYKYLGDIHFNHEDLAAAKVNYELALSTIRTEQDRHLYANIILKQSQIYCKTMNFQAAEPLAQKALELGREVNSRLLIHDALKVLSKVDLQKGSYRLATQKLNEMNLYADTLFNQQLSEKVLSMEFQLERQKQEAALDIMKKDKEIQTLRLDRQRFINTGLIIFVLFLGISGSIMLFLIRKLNEKNKLLIVQKEELKQTNAAKDRMFMVIGHDLRGPVWNLRALIELLKEEQDSYANEDMHENFTALSRAVQSVSDLLENLLYWAKSQDGKIIFKPGPTDLKYLITKSIEPYRTWAETKNVSIDFQTDMTTAMVNADENMVQTVIRNLLSNAIKYSFRNGVISISLTETDQQCRFSIKDNGMGIQQEQIDLIFSNETTLTTKGTGNEMGSGIGLGLCRDFISRHGSDIQVESIPNKGTRFFFDLPLMERP